MVVVEAGLWLLIGSVIYSMTLYPLAVMALSRAFAKKFKRETITPSVSLIISALNEEASIAAKVENSLALDYPPGRLEIIVASDGSTDRTDAIVRRFADRGVRLLRFEGGLGKSAVLNEAVRQARGEILVFSDATGRWSSDAVALLASHYADPRVGCVSGRVGYSYDRSLTSRGFRVYQKYALALRRAEAAFGSGFNASGSIHSIRASLFRPGPPDTFMDMVDPLHVAMQGHRTTFEENALSMESSRQRTADEFRARLRIALRAWRFMAYALPRLPLLQAPMYCFQVVSHKFLRWTVGPALLLVLCLNLVLLGEGSFYRWLLAAQMVYYGLTGLAFLFGKLGAPLPLVSGLVFFNTTNLAYVVSLLRYLRGERVRQWIPVR
ncbi:MAG TPA: glycosyltransferase [Candidatus Polarisedimenticolia bacterium]|nr:glycosyltransferase [Candidatus Polarisedimenticolia bacterium]